MSSARKTINHDEIRAWVEKNNGRPSCVKGTGGKDDPGMLRIDFDAKEDKLEPISWDEWFEQFDRNELALLHSDDSRFNKLVSRTGDEDDGDHESGAKASGGSHGSGAKSSASSSAAKSSGAHASHGKGSKSSGASRSGSRASSGGSHKSGSHARS